jgi:hypothetical protein
LVLVDWLIFGLCFLPAFCFCDIFVNTSILQLANVFIHTTVIIPHPDLIPSVEPSIEPSNHRIPGDSIQLSNLYPSFDPTMGACLSVDSEISEQKKRSQMIDRRLEEDSRRLRRECKILLLGMFSSLSTPLFISPMFTPSVSP